MPDIPGVPRDRKARPSLDEALALRHDAMALDEEWSHRQYAERDLSAIEASGTS